MSTTINVTVGGNGLLDQSRQQMQANRFGRMEGEIDSKVMTEISRQKPVVQNDAIGLPLNQRRLKQEPAATRRIVKADYYVISYGFTTGLDLDTRTFLRNPRTLELVGPVGWCKDSTITLESKDVVTWGGDNTGTGVEAVLFDRIAYENVFGKEENRALIGLNANWYRDKGSEVIIEVTGYKGGSMIADGFSWANPDATKRYDKFSTYHSRAVNSNISGCVDGDFIAFLLIDYAKGSVSYLQELPS